MIDHYSLVSRTRINAVILTSKIFMSIVTCRGALKEQRHEAKLSQQEQHLHEELETKLSAQEQLLQVLHPTSVR